MSEEEREQERGCCLFDAAGLAQGQEKWYCQGMFLGIETDAEKTGLLAGFGGWGGEGLVTEEAFILSCRKGGCLWSELRGGDVKQHSYKPYRCLGRRNSNTDTSREDRRRGERGSSGNRNERVEDGRSGFSRLWFERK